MKAILSFLLTPLLLAAADPARPVPEAQKEADLATRISEHQQGAVELSDKQDVLAADVQQLTIEQTSEEVSKMLKEVETAMDDSSQRLLDHDTGNDTIAAQTDVIEKIHDAAKKHQQQSKGQGDASGAMMEMMEMMERMMGQEPGGKKDGQTSDKGLGEGKTGDSDSANTGHAGPVNGGKEEQRRVPKASGTAGQSLPNEFQGALDAYNRAAGKLSK